MRGFVLGTLIGAERQYRQRTAGLRTNVLVAVGAAAFVDLAMHLTGADGAVRVIAYVVSGIGFLGAGVDHERRHERARAEYRGDAVGLGRSRLLCRRGHDRAGGAR